MSDQPEHVTTARFCRVRSANSGEWTPGHKCPACEGQSQPRGSHDAGRSCRCQATHRPQPLEYEQHHIWPLGMGGADVAANIEWVCPTTHTNIHELLRHMMRAGPLTWGEVEALYDVPVSRHAYAVAAEGYRRWRAGSHVPPEEAAP